MTGIVPAIAMTEIRLGSRNRWVLLAAAALTLFAMVLGFIGAAPTGTVKTGALTVTVASLATLSVYLVPLMALLLSFDAIAGEVERGTIQLILASPASKPALIAGKFLGHIAILGFAIITGFGLTGGVIWLMAGGSDDGVWALARLIATSIGLGAAFLAIGYIASSLARQSGTAAALAVGIWLVAVVLYDLALFSALVADADGLFAKSVFPWLLLVNPADAFRLFNMSLLESASGVSEIATALPFPAWTGILSLAFWTVAAFFLSAQFLRKLEP